MLSRIGPFLILIALCIAFSPAHGQSSGTEELQYQHQGSIYPITLAHPVAETKGLVIFVPDTATSPQSPEATSYLQNLTSMGFAVAAVGYPNSITDGFDCAELDSKVQGIFSRSKETSALNVILSHLDLGGSPGISVVGEGQGSWIVHQAARYSGDVQIRSALLLGTGNQIASDSQQSAVSLTCNDYDSNNIGFVLAVTGENDRLYVPSAADTAGDAESRIQELGGQMAAVTGVSCKGAFGCYDPYRKSGWVLVPNDEVADGDADHAFFLDQLTGNLDPVWEEGMQRWGLATTTQWIFETYFSFTSAGECIDQPPQPSSGPGGADYKTKRVHVIRRPYRYPAPFRNLLAHQVAIYEPARKMPGKLPVLFYLPGYGATLVGTAAYDQELRHFAKKGYIVVFITYGSILLPQRYRKNAIDGFRQSIAMLHGSARLINKPDLDRMAFGGHSIGAMLAAILDNDLERLNLRVSVPHAKLLIIHDADGIDSFAASFMNLNDLSKVPADTLMLFVASQDGLKDRVNHVVNDSLATIYELADGVPQSNKIIVAPLNDYHGCKPMLSNHMGPVTKMLSPFGPGVETDPVPGALDAIDWYGYWLPTEAAMEYAFHNNDGDYLFGDSPLSRNMGQWSDGTPVKPRLITGDFRLSPPEEE